jgi:hypothetical protein
MARVMASAWPWLLGAFVIVVITAWVLIVGVLGVAIGSRIARMGGRIGNLSNLGPIDV